MPCWVKKYRLSSIRYMAYQDEVVSVLRKSLSWSDFHNMLFWEELYNTCCFQ